MCDVRQIQFYDKIIDWSEGNMRNEAATLKCSVNYMYSLL
jgi:hypothetical protein